MSRARLNESTRSLRNTGRRPFNPRNAIKKAESWAGETILLSATVVLVVFSFMWFA